ncbi:MAG: hypothetical protein GKR91_08585 [Pseudomonadales bacterium]|nr:hypothetical protein [Pseudomonadales bacterium]
MYLIKNGITRFRLGLLILALNTLISCNSPYSLEIGSYNENGPQVPAVITLSDPQIYARETLVNDRLREGKLLDRLLEESSFIGELSESKDFRDRFSSQIVRDLATYQSFLTQLSVESDPFAGSALERGDRLNELAFERQELEALTELARARQTYQDVLSGNSSQSNNQDTPPANSQGTANPPEDSPPDSNQQTGDTPDTSGNQTSTGSTGDGGQEPDSSSGDSVAGNSQQGNEEQPSNQPQVESELAAIRTALADLVSSDRIPSNSDLNSGISIEPDPRDQFRDLQAYRSELRQAQSSINLDDLHDFAGNALYRLQFRASVMPGKHKDKLGVARLTFEAPAANKNAIANLYNTWLAHVTERMSSYSNQDETSATRIARLEGANLFRFIRIGFPGDNFTIFSSAVHPEIHDDVLTALSTINPTIV